MCGPLSPLSQYSLMAWSGKTVFFYLLYYVISQKTSMFINAAVRESQDLKYYALGEYNLRRSY